MTSSARVTEADYGLSVDQLLRRTAAGRPGLSGQQQESVATIDFVSPSPQVAARCLPVGGIDLTRSPQARQPAVHCGAARRPHLPERKRRPSSGLVPAQLQRSPSIISIGDSPAAAEAVPVRLQLGTSRRPEDADAFSPEPAQMFVPTNRSLRYSLPPGWSPTSTPGTSPEPEVPMRTVPRCSMYTTWCAERVIMLAMYLHVGNSKLTNAGVRPLVNCCTRSEV